MTNYQKNEPDSIKQMFGSIAKKYDRANAILSFNLHRSWNKKLVNQFPSPKKNQLLMDLCCGTGDIGYAYLSRTNVPQKMIMVDFCSEMLECAKEKAHILNLNHHHINYVEADVQSLPIGDFQVDFASMAYGIRNVQDPLKCFKEVFRVLKPGGSFGILELSKPSNKFIRLGHRLYLKTVLPLVGRWITSNREAYEYLCNSIPQFTQTVDVEELLKIAGFSNVSMQALTFGTAKLFLGVKKK